MSKPRLLIIASHYTPVDAVAAVRINYWGNALQGRGWDVAVATRRWASEPAGEPVAVHFLSATKRAAALRGHRGPFERLQTHMSIPDSTAPFWRSRKAEILEIARQARPHVVLSSSPPHALQTIAGSVARAVGARWVADLRDPMTGDIRFDPSGLRRLRGSAPHRRAEARVLREADLAVVALPSLIRDLTHRYPGEHQKLRLITNGYPRALSEEASQSAADESRVRVVCSIGKIGLKQAEQLATAVRFQRTMGRKVVLRLVTGDGEAVAAAARILVDGGLSAPGQVTHGEAMAFARQADVLASCLSEDRSAANLLSSRLFEYLAVGKPLLCVNPTDDDRKLLQQFGITWLHRPSTDEVSAALEARLAGTIGAPSAADHAAFLGQYSREGQVTTLDLELRRLLERDPQCTS